MNIQDRLHALMVLRCRRCNTSAQRGLYVGQYLLCPACLGDFQFWLETPPEIPTSSDTMLRTDEQEAT